MSQPPRTPEPPRRSPGRRPVGGDASWTSDPPPLRSISSLSDASCLSDDTTTASSPSPSSPSPSCGETSYRGAAAAADDDDDIWSEPGEDIGARILRVAGALRASAVGACAVRPSRSAPGRALVVLSWLALAAAACVGGARGHVHRPPPVRDCVYVPGGGFSGFWFTLGRLRSLPAAARRDRDYYCYSAGCLAVVATALLDRDMEQLYDMAHDVQQRWRAGKVGRYSVVQTFLDDVLDGLDPSKNRTRTSDHATVIDEQTLSRIHIITTAQNEYSGLRTAIRTATSVAELHEMLLQTTWIPYATGDGLWRNGHMDGAFSAPFHPACRSSVGLAMHPGLLANVVNVNLSWQSVEKFWNLGLEYGLN